MRTVYVNLGERSYPIHIGRSARTLLADWLRQHARDRQIVVIADQAVADLHLATLRTLLPADPLVVTFPPGEASKSLATVQRMYAELADARIERGSVILTLGGGVAGDLGGFVAATWLRGVRFVQVATTLLAAVDASVGGKTGVNLPAGKNLVGAFHQPGVVIIDVDFLQTLPARDFTAGLAESVKQALIRDAVLLDWHQAQADAIRARRPEVITELIARNCEIKAAVVSADERETGQRAILNYGHTVGHALEHLLEYELRHGECVGLGMIVENELSCARGWLPHADADRIRALLQRLGMPVRLPRKVEPADVAMACRLDKKVRGGMAEFVLLRQIGTPQLGVGDITDDQLAAGLRAIQPE